MVTGNTEKSVLQALEKTPRSRQELKALLQQKHIKSTLRHLCERGEIKKVGRRYVRSVLTDENKLFKKQSAAKTQAVVPIAMQMRQATKNKSVKIVLPQEDIDEEIRRLEAELEKSSSSDESSDDDSEASADRGVVSLSRFAEDRIENLPPAALPLAGRYNPRDGMKPAKKKRRRDDDKNDEVEVSSGLREAVKEVLSGYKARSSERLPFYCRVCSKQYANENEFFDHKNTPFHKTAVDMERKASYCKLCRKQLTSPEQMKEHLSSRPHRERLRKMKDRQAESKRQPIGRRQWK
eukprot:scaffold1489_cov194-Cylindrotheca_fusiformis.AAC.17